MSTKSSVDLDIERQSRDQDSSGQSKHSGKRWSFVGWSRDTPTVTLLMSRKTENSPDDLATGLRHRAVGTLFGLPSTHFSDWDGLLVFFYHLESCFQELLDPHFEIIWKLLGHTIPSTSVDVWHWCFTVVNAYESEGGDPSIEKIYQRILENAHDETSPGETRYPPTEDEKEYTLQAIFSILCWTSATLNPIVGKRAIRHSRPVSNRDLDNEESTLQLKPTILLAENCSHIYSSGSLRRPTSKMFRSYLPQVDDNNDYESRNPVCLSMRATTQAPGYYYEDILYESTLNYNSLSSIGHIRLRLVDTLTAHLAFDSTTRELSVYRYPSFCVTKILSRHRIEVLENITEKLLSQYFSNSDRESYSIYREVLLSYRLLFGQSPKSRKIFSRILNQPPSNSKTRTLLVGASQAENLDPFLEILCTSSLHSGWSFLGIRFGGKQNVRIQGELFPLSALNEHGQLSELDYSARDHFPTFGPRLLALQKFNMGRQPSKMLDLWRDTRNPLQWHTFWAVLLVGGAGILLGIFQLVVSIIQVVYSVKSTP